MLESARIMKRRFGEVNTLTQLARSFFFFVLAVVMFLTLSSCGGDVRRADRLWRRAMECVEQGDTQGAVDRLQEIIDSYPDTSMASRAREQIVVYRGLAAAVKSYPSRRVRELMVQIARAIEAFRRESGHAPATLDALVPTRLAIVPLDPWARAFSYEATAGGYRLTCSGADGMPGGVAESEDLVVVDGEFVTESP